MDSERMNYWKCRQCEHDGSTKPCFIITENEFEPESCVFADLSPEWKKSNKQEFLNNKKGSGRMRLLCDEMHEGLLVGKEYYTTCKDLPNTNVYASIRDSELRFTLKPSMEHPLCETINVSWLNADWQEVYKYDNLTFQEALSGMKELHMYTYDGANGHYLMPSDNVLLFEAGNIIKPSNKSFNFLSKKKWKEVGAVKG